jgi:1-acyl-sn-glycerol-3-phosphate acyltransferase
LFWVFLILSSVALFPAALVVWALTWPFDRRRWVLHRFTCFWASLYTWLNPAWPVSIEGRDRVHPGRPAVMVANHLSLVDILVLFRTFLHFKWVSKVENFRVPLIGWNMSLNGYIKIDRGDRASAAQMMKACARTLAQGSSVMMFPEGTRSPSGRMRPFKPGAFDLALRTQSPIQPILIRGSAQALPRRGFMLRGRHPIHVTVLDPIPPESFAQLSTGELAARVHSLMATALGEA